jgi:hypothetical protein
VTGVQTCALPISYASETWVLKETIIQKLLVLERKILRRIFGPTKENQIWRIKTMFTYKECQIPEQFTRYLNGNP